jgi:CRISPR-associated exonuclease Cas4|nr:CRISPR-associated protein Cas4 [Thermovirga lienii]
MEIAEMSFCSGLSEKARIGGTLVWYYFICKRQVWLMARGIEPERTNDALMIGKLLSERTYERERHNVKFGDNSFDIVRKEEGVVVVGEIKKSSRFEHAAKMQLLHYLYVLQKDGVEAEGELLFPKERKKERVKLESKTIKLLEQIYEDIHKLAEAANPPVLKRNRYCSGCAYRYWCWS